MNGISNVKNKLQHTIRCRSCGDDLIKGTPECVRVEVGKIAGMEGGYEDWDEKGDPWGYMHLRCFYLAVGDPRAISSMRESSAVST